VIFLARSHCRQFAGEIVSKKKAARVSPPSNPAKTLWPPAAGFSFVFNLSRVKIISGGRQNGLPAAVCQKKISRTTSGAGEESPGQSLGLPGNQAGPGRLSKQPFWPAPTTTYGKHRPKKKGLYFRHPPFFPSPVTGPHFRSRGVNYSRERDNEGPRSPPAEKPLIYFLFNVMSPKTPKNAKLTPASTLTARNGTTEISSKLPQETRNAKTTPSSFCGPPQRVFSPHENRQNLPANSPKSPRSGNPTGFTFEERGGRVQPPCVKRAVFLRTPTVTRVESRAAAITPHWWRPQVRAARRHERSGGGRASITSIIFRPPSRPAAFKNAGLIPPRKSPGSESNLAPSVFAIGLDFEGAWSWENTF